MGSCSVWLSLGRPWRWASVWFWSAQKREMTFAAAATDLTGDVWKTSLRRVEAFSNAFWFVTWMSLTNGCTRGFDARETVRDHTKLLVGFVRGNEERVRESMGQQYLEYCVHFWSPGLQKDIAELEKVQKEATKSIRRLNHLSFRNIVFKLRFEMEGFVSTELIPGEKLFCLSETF